jgi:peptidylprolyl isomerase
MADTKPDVTIPDGEPPSELLVEDIEVGEGTEAVSGATVTVHYVGHAWSDGQQFDASWDRNDTFAFRRVAGMKIGGRRRITIPPHKGYGDRGAGGVIKGGETLVFVVDLLNVG